MIFQAVATCGFGLESVVTSELRRMGFANISTHDGRVFFSSDGLGIATANIALRTAERVLLVLSEFPADTFDALFDGVKEIAWEDVIGSHDAFPVKGFTMNSTLHSVPACQSIIKKAVVTRLQRAYSSVELPEDNNIEKRIQFSIVKDVCTVMLDTSGDGLHKRGYRPLHNMAPIRETLGAGIADFARIRDNHAVCDPFCGSGTLVIEAALRAINRAPGINRSFSGEHYSFLGRGIFRQAKENARSAERIAVGFTGRGFDIDPEAAALAIDNAKRAGVAHCTTFTTGDARKFMTEQEEILLCNPPYGERLDNENIAGELIHDFGKNLKSQLYRGLYIISNHPRFEHLFGKSAVRRRKLYNGMLPCQLHMYY